MFNEHKAKKMANAAWEIINPGYIDSPEIKYHIELEGENYLNIVIELGYKLKIVVGDKLNGDRMIVLEALKLNNNLGFVINAFHEGDWCKTIQETHKNALKARHEARIEALAPLEKKPKKFRLILGGK